MDQKPGRPLGRTVLILLGLCLSGALLAPVVVYLFGSTVMGPYEGEGGLAGFAGAVIAAAFARQAGAVSLLLAPTALVLTWWVLFRWLRRPRIIDEAESDKS